MDYRIVFRNTGGPEVLEIETLGLAPPGPGEVLLRQDAIGLNFIDIYYRTGLYPAPLPSGLGSEAAGIVEAVGPGVDELKPGDRVAYATRALGAYASARIMPVGELVAVPDGISNETAAAVMLKGMTAEFLIERCAAMRPGQTALVHAAAGGVGSLLVQWLRSIGVMVIAHASNDAKATIVRNLGIDAVASCPIDELAPWVRDQTGGRGVDVVFDGIGAASWNTSLAAVAKRGLIISYGNASGPVPPIALFDLMKAGSAYVTRPTLWDYCATAPELRASAARLFSMIASGAARAEIGRRFPLKDAAAAHQLLSERKTTGSTILRP